jgi:hypothetical protein
MVGSKTCENWEKGLFFLQDTLIPEDDQGPGASHDLIVSIGEISEGELSLIRAIQKEHGSTLTRERVRMAKRIFLKKLDRTVHQKLLIQKGLIELEYILQGAISKRKLVFCSELFDFTLDRSYLNGIADIYGKSIERKEFNNFEFIASPTRFDNLNRSSSEIWTYALCDLLEWLKEMESGKVNELEKLKKKKNFIIALSFANGDIYRWVKEEGMSARECAAKLKMPTLHPFVSETLKYNSVSQKCLYRNKKLVRNLKDYCDFYGLEVNEKFEELSLET